MSKKAFISLSIFVMLIVLIGVLFGTVFVLRTQTVVVVGDSPVAISKEDIISSAGLENGKAIFMLDKDAAAANIEAKHADVKVVQIKTVSISEIEILIRARHKMFYATFNNKNYILDEDLKVLDIKNELSDEDQNLTKIEDENLEINQSTLKCDFVGAVWQREASQNLYTALLNNVKTKNEEETEYYSRMDFAGIFKTVKFEEFETFNKIIITTDYGVKFDIENPNKDLTNKLNICLTAMNRFVADESDNREDSGTIKIYFDLNGEQQSVYINENQQGQ